MDNFLIQTFSIKNHPICELKEKFRVQYVMGLGEFMCYMSKKDNRASLVFKVWARSIVENVPASYWQCSKKFVLVKKALSIKRDGLRLFTMRRSFFFDCLYLVSKMDSKARPTAFTFLMEHVHGIFARKILKNIYNNWGYPSLQKIPSQLMSHWRIDNDFQKKPLKRILVVATMNAGKSTLINALTGYRINEVRATACTEKSCHLYNKPATDGITIKGNDGHFFYRYDTDANEIKDFTESAFHFSSSLADCRVCFIDTPGVNYSKVTQHGNITHQIIKDNNYDLLLFVSNSNYFGTTDEGNLLKIIIQQTKKPLICVLNKIDTFKETRDSIDKMINDFYKILNQFYKKASVIPISAEAALYFRSNTSKFDADELMEYEQYKRKFSNIYYDLPSYINGTHGKNIIDRTGISLLERTIKNTII